MCNISDDGDTTTGDLFNIISNIFNIHIQFLGKFKTLIAQFAFDDLIQTKNETHMKIWLNLL